MKWKYKGEDYESIKIDWKSVYDKCGVLEEVLPDEYKGCIVKIPWSFNPECSDILVCIPKYDKLYLVQRFGVMGNGGQIKFGLEDIMTKQYIYVGANNVELVIKSK